MRPTKIIKSNTMIGILGSLIGLTLLGGIESARILGYFLSTANSHLIIHCSVAQTLAQAGHDVTVISNVANVFENAGYRFIHLDGPTMDDGFDNFIVRNPKPAYYNFPTLIHHMGVLSNDSLSHPTMQKFLQDHGEGSFDLLIVGFFLNDFNLGLAAHFKCPVIINFMMQPIFYLNDFIGNPTEIAYVPLLYAGLHQPLNFFGRVTNFLAFLYEKYVIEVYMDHKAQLYYNYHFPADRYPPLEELRKNVSLIMVNRHSESQGPIRPNVPALIEIGGIQIKEQPNPLPMEIQKFINQSENGFIYISMGSVVKARYLDPEKVKLIFQVLSNLPYLVLWKWDGNDFPGRASNIIYKDWLPQDDILAHPKCKLFITHGGLGSVTESEYHGVPMLGLPFFSDQPANIAKVVKSGFGLSILMKTLTEESFRATLKEVLDNPSYSEAVKRFSRLYRDRPMSPQQKVLYWCEHVIRHQGAKHLQSPAVFLNYWQLHSMDVIAFLLLIVGSFFGMIVFGIKVCCCRRKSLVSKSTDFKKNN